MKIDLENMKTVGINPKVMGGQPCLVGHRITIAQILAEIVDCGDVNEVEHDYELDSEVKAFLEELADKFARMR